MQMDALGNKLHKVTRKLFRDPHQSPVTHHFISEPDPDPSHPPAQPTPTTPPDIFRDAVGNVNWRPARNTMEELHGTKQMHTNWTGTAGEQTMCHFIRRITNPDGTTSHFRLHVSTLEPTDDDII